MVTVQQPDRVAVRARIVRAAAELLRAHGAAGVTTRSVAEQAAVQQPTIYRLFGDKDGLLDAVAEHELARYVDAKSQLADGDPVAALCTAWHNHIRFGLAHPALFSYLTDPARAPRSPAARAGMDVLRARVHRIAAAGRLRVEEGHAVDLIHAAGTGAVSTLLASSPDHRDPHLADGLLDAVLMAVLSDAEPTEHDNTVAAAVTLRAAADELVSLSAGERMLFVEWLDRVVSDRGRGGA